MLAAKDWLVSISSPAQRAHWLAWRALWCFNNMLGREVGRDTVRFYSFSSREYWKKTFFFVVKFHFYLWFPPSSPPLPPLFPPRKWSGSSANKQIDRNEQNAFQVLAWMLPSVSVSWMAEPEEFINCQCQFWDVSTISPHRQTTTIWSSQPCWSYNTIHSHLISLFASDIYELLNGAFQIVPDCRLGTQSFTEGV